VEQLARAAEADAAAAVPAAVDRQAVREAVEVPKVKLSALSALICSNKNASSEIQARRFGVLLRLSYCAKTYPRNSRSKYLICKRASSMVRAVHSSWLNLPERAFFTLANLQPLSVVLNSGKHSQPPTKEILCIKSAFKSEARSIVFR
jgi:hypothetical protein